MPVKIIHTIWVGGPLPDYADETIAEWRLLNPGWRWRHWTDTAVDDFGLYNRSLYDQADKLTSHPHEAGQFRADLARYEILHRLGGLYVDCDVWPLRPIDGLVEGVEEFGIGWESDDTWVGNSIMYAPKAGHQLLAEAITKVRVNVDTRDPQWRPNRMTGPTFFTPIVKHHADQVTFWPASAVYPVHWSGLDAIPTDFGDAYTVHLWANSHRGQGRDINHTLAQVMS